MLALIMATVISMTTPSFNTDGSPLVDLEGVDLYRCGSDTPEQTWVGTTPGTRISFQVFNNYVTSRCYEARAFDTALNYSVASESVTVPRKRYRCYRCHQ